MIDKSKIVASTTFCRGSSITFIQDECVRRINIEILIAVDRYDSELRFMHQL